MNYLHLLAPLAMIALSACSPRQDDAPSPQASNDDGTAGDPSEADARAAPVELSSTVDEDSAQETAQEYIARRGSRPGGVDGNVAPEAIGAVAVCTVCHGAEGEGNPVLNAPRIGGMEAWYVARQLKYFKQGIRAETAADVHGTQMRAIALTLENNAVIEDLAEHISDMDPPPVPPSVSGDAERGEELYALCAACHGEDGRGTTELNTPSMVGQDGGYLVRQLQNYRNGLRGSHDSDIFGQQMQPIVESALEGEDDVVDVVAYIVTLGTGTEASSPTRDGATSAADTEPADPSG